VSGVFQQRAIDVTISLGTGTFGQSGMNTVKLLYLGGFLNSTPTTYVRMSGGNVDIVCPGTIDLSAAGGTFIDGRKFLTHEHTNGNMGGNTGGVV
jgi:hypothetical protein